MDSNCEHTPHELELPSRSKTPRHHRNGAEHAALPSIDGARTDAARSCVTIHIPSAEEEVMQVSQAMSKDVRIANPNQSICDAAKMMAEIDAGALPVGENDRLVGMITDRDIAVRAVALNKGPDTPIRQIMSKDVKYCFADDDLEEVCQNMADIKVRRLPVLDRNQRLVGIVSLGDVALTDGATSAGDALCGISEPGGAHSQSAEAKASRRM
jgi:CBS domain-containing protein